MISHIKLKAQYIHPSENLSDYPSLKKFKETIQFAKKFDIGTCYLYGEKEPEFRILSISNNEGVFHQIIRKQYLLNTCKELDELTLTQYSALISILNRKEGSFNRLTNSNSEGNPILQELTNQTFGWLLWSWQIMGLVSYYLPKVEPSTFINHIHKDNKAAWRLLIETKINSGISLYELMEMNSLGLQYDTPSYYFGEQLQLLIKQ